jgi:hypothetical protein
MRKYAPLVILPLLLTSCTKTHNAKEPNPAVDLPDSTIVAIATEAYTFGLPLILMDITRRQMIDASNPYGAPENTFRHRSEFPDASFRDVVRPNADTYYSTANLDLQEEPIILSLPDTRGRYYMMPIMDAYTNVFASPGSRTSGNKAGNFLLVGPQWKGEVPLDLQAIKSPTNHVWIIGRTQVNSKADGDQVVVPLQQQYLLTPLSAFGRSSVNVKPKADPTVPKGSPNDVVVNMPASKFFNYMNQLMVHNPPTTGDHTAMERFAVIGVGPNEKFEMTKFSRTAQAAINKIPETVISNIKKQMTNRGLLENGWNPMEGKQGAYGTDYSRRAAIAFFGLGANLPEDAMYPSASFDGNGEPLNGTNQYIIHFDKDQTPPAYAFWSLTVYDPNGYFVPNPINRYAIGDRSNLKQHEDGSTDIYIQHISPGPDKETNWLPAPPGEFNIVMRVYWPKEEMLNGTWKKPPIRKVK